MRVFSSTTKILFSRSMHSRESCCTACPMRGMSDHWELTCCCLQHGGRRRSRVWDQGSVGGMLTAAPARSLGVALQHEACCSAAR